MEMQVHGFEVLGDDGQVDNALSRRVVHLEVGFPLRPTHLDQSLLQGGYRLGGVVHGPQFGLHGRGHHQVDRAAQGDPGGGGVGGSLQERAGVSVKKSDIKVGVR